MSYKVCAAGCDQMRIIFLNVAQFYKWETKTTKNLPHRIQGN